MDRLTVGAKNRPTLLRGPPHRPCGPKFWGVRFSQAGLGRRLDMRSTCNHYGRMSKMIQIRNVPDEIHRVLKLRAVQAGMTLSDYLLKEVTAVAQRTTVEELTQRIRRRGAAQPGEDSVEAVRAERDGRG